MKVRALKTFRGRYGLIRTGMVFECDPGYFRALAKTNMVEIAEKETAPSSPAPSDNRSKPEAPHRGGKEVPGGQGKPPGGTDPRTVGGPGITSRSLRADLASRRKTSSKSVAGVSVQVQTTSETETPDPASTPPDA